MKLWMKQETLCTCILSLWQQYVGPQLYGHIVHQSEEDVCDDIIHGRQKYSEH